jgi:hypothetical protein
LKQAGGPKGRYPNRARFPTPLSLRRKLCYHASAGNRISELETQI